MFCFVCGFVWVLNVLLLFVFVFVSKLRTNWRCNVFKYMIWSEKSQFNNYILQLHKVKSICQPIQEQHQNVIHLSNMVHEPKLKQSIAPALTKFNKSEIAENTCT